MEEASRTIDRHTPIIPESIWFDLDPQAERIYTKVKNRLILRQPYLKELNANGKGVILPKHPERVITDDMLKRAEDASFYSAGIFNDRISEYLSQRSLTKFSKQYRFCSTAILISRLSFKTIAALTLRLPNKLQNYITSPVIEGISIPYYFKGKFCGFATRVLSEELVKYAFSIPHRLCFGLEFDQDEVYVVEGVFDAMAMKERGFNVLGIGDSQPNYFKMMQAAKFDKINLLFDNDYAGWLGAIKAFVILTEMLDVNEERISILELQNAKDPKEANGVLWTSKITFKDALTKARYLRDIHES